ncbi:MAG: putative addiction module antidote protein [Gammaproteobacteria bacterium]|nr:putative addiction module antidote protein [Gammaproteobacteria bacterium]
MTKLIKFDAAEYLDSEEVIAEYLNAALEDEDPNVFLAAIGDIAKARGMTELAKEAGLGRESLYKALTPGAKPRYDTVLRVIRALGVELLTVPVQQKSIPTRRSSGRASARR